MKLAKRMRRFGWVSFAAMFVTIPAALILPDSKNSLAPAVVIGNIILTMILLLGSEIPRMLAHRSVQQNGMPAEARILKIWETGTRVNDNPLVGIRLEVRPPGRPAFETETEQIISILGIPGIQPGATVKVRYNPDSRAVTLVEE